MKFIDFPMSNLTLTAPEGQEDQVAPLPTRRSAGYITACIELNEEERKAVAERGIIWLSFMDVNPKGPAFFPPVRPDVLNPALVDLPEIRVDTAIADRCHVLQYLDLNLVALQVEPEEHSFRFRSITRRENGENVHWHALEFSTDGHSLNTEKYLFHKTLEVLGRFREIPEFPWLKYIFPNLPEDYLILKPKPEAKPAASIIQLARR